MLGAMLPAGRPRPNRMQPGAPIMIPPARRQHSTLRTAQAALGEIASRGQPADPRTFSVWYNFVAGESGMLTEAVDARLARDDTLSAKDVDELYGTLIAPGNVSDKVDRLGAQVADEIDQVMAMVTAAEGTASTYSANLADVSKRLDSTRDRAGVRQVVEGLVLTTREMGSINSRLQSQLQVMRDEISRLRNEIELVRNESLTDALTSLGNRKFFNATLENAVAAAHARKQALTLMLADVDHFKKINDSYGHVIGDHVLRFVASTIRGTLGEGHIGARYGGEEFAVIMPNAAIDEAMKCAERLRQTVMKGELVRRSTGKKHAALTISIGVAKLHAGATAQSLIEAADVCLYAAKRSGRNCVVSETDEKLLDVVAG
jgi:diguanylate cyclase